MRVPFRFLFTAIGIALASQTPFTAMAQSGPFPNRAVHIFVGAPPGGSNDLIARAISQKMGEALGQTVVVDNRPGAGGNLAAGLVAKAPPDGYTVFMTPSSHAFSATMYDKLPFDPVKDFEPVGQIGRLPLIVLVNKSLPVNSLKDLVELARAKPGTINFGSGGSGAPQHLAGELLKSVTGTQMTHVPYKGTGPAMTDLIAGQIQMMIEPLSSALPQVKGGNVKALATTGQARAPVLPDVPTTREAGYPGLDISAWYGLLAPAGTPSDVIAKLNAALNSALAESGTKTSLLQQGLDITPGAPPMFMDLIVAEIARWRPIIQKANIHAD